MDIPEVLATYDALVGVALGAGLTYGFSALSRRHQEAREDRTRWYEARLQAYSEFYRVYYEALYRSDHDVISEEQGNTLRISLLAAVGPLTLTASREASKVAVELAEETAKRVGMGANYNLERLTRLNEAFHDAARKDLGHP
jgi:hypothetical protein